MKHARPFVLLLALAGACSKSSDLATSPMRPDGNVSRSVGPTTVFDRSDLGTLGGASSYAADINDNGTVVGWSETATGARHAFRWTAKTGMIDLGTLPGDGSSEAVAVADGNNGGEILGVSGASIVTWSPSGAITVLPIPLLLGFGPQMPTGFNSKGQIVGWEGGQHGWFWSASAGKIDLKYEAPFVAGEGWASGITPSGVVVGTIDELGACRPSPVCYRAYLWTASRGYEGVGLPRGSNATTEVAAWAVNDRRQVVGWTNPGPADQWDPWRAYSWTASGGFKLLPIPSSLATGSSSASAVNSGGMIVGYIGDLAAGGVQPVAWLANGDVIQLSPDEPDYGFPIAVNASGVIAGWGIAPQGTEHAFVWTQVRGTSNSHRNAPRVARVSVTTPAERCLSDTHAMAARPALLQCVWDAGRSR